tara:strand:- start:38 stop:187 length:150 start_codon:yes stop_codon:yes gene_type:complete
MDPNETPSSEALICEEQQLLPYQLLSQFLPVKSKVRTFIFTIILNIIFS